MSTAYFNAVYSRLGVLLTDDDLAGESMYQPLMDATVERLDDAGLLVEAEGGEGGVPARLRNRTVIRCR